MNSYIILRRYKDQRDCALAEFIIFNEKVYLTRILINNDKRLYFTSQSLIFYGNDGIILSYKYNIDKIYSPILYSFSNLGKSIEEYSIEINPYDVPFIAENDEEAKLRFELDEY